jgi:hypothetical protein
VSVDSTELDRLYLRAASLRAKAFFVPADMALVEYVELARLRRELSEIYDLGVS